MTTRPALFPAIRIARAITSMLAPIAGCGGALSASEMIPPAWRFATQAAIYSSPSADANDGVYIGSDDRHVYALDGRTGTLRWKQAMSHAVRSQPLVDGDAVLVVAGNDALSLNRVDGAVRWTFSPRETGGAAPADRWDYHTSSLVRSGSHVCYGAGNGMLYALDASSGALVFSSASEGNAAIRTTPAVADGIIFFGDWNGVIYAVSAEDGSQRWKQATLTGPKPYPQFGAAVSRMCVADGLVYFGLRNPAMLSLAAKDGRVVWRVEAENGSWVAGSPVVAGDTVFLSGSDDHQLHALGVGDGAGRWSCAVTGNMFVAPLVIGGRLIVSDGDSYAEDAGRGHLHVIDRGTGRLLRTVPVGGNACASSPLLVAGRVVVGSEDGFVSAFDLAKLLE